MLPTLPRNPPKKIKILHATQSPGNAAKSPGSSLLPLFGGRSHRRRGEGTCTGFAPTSTETQEALLSAVFGKEKQKERGFRQGPAEAFVSLAESRAGPASRGAPARRCRRFSTGHGQRPVPPRPRRSRRPLAAAAPRGRCSSRLAWACCHSAEREAGLAPRRAPLLCNAALHWPPGLPRAAANGQRSAPLTHPPGGQDKGWGGASPAGAETKGPRGRGHGAGRAGVWRVGRSEGGARCRRGRGEGRGRGRARGAWRAEVALVCRAGKRLERSGSGVPAHRPLPASAAPRRHGTGQPGTGERRDGRTGGRTDTPAGARRASGGTWHRSAVGT